MRKMLFVTFALIIAVTVLAMPVLADQPLPNAEGEWTYAPIEQEVKIAGCNTFIFMTDRGTFTGTFTGLEEEVDVVTGHCNGKWSHRGNLTFTGEVDGRSGSLEMRIVGTSEDFSYWEGTWVILTGTGGLENLRGLGTWNGVPGDLDYTGYIHFEPN